MWDIEYIDRNAHYEEMMTNEMNERREEILKDISKIIGQDLSEYFLDLIIAAHDWDIPEGDFFITRLDLNKKDFCCLKGDKEGYREILHNEYCSACS